MSTISDNRIDSVLLIGPTGAGKTPLGEYLGKNGLSRRQCHHLDFGHELRMIAGWDAPETPFTYEDVSFIRGVLNNGLLLEGKHFHIAEKVIRSFLERKGFVSRHLLVLNGIPRHVGQAKDMARIVNIRELIVLDCQAEDVFDRIRGNRGGDRTNRDDDSFEMVRHKLAIFMERTSALIDYYRMQGCRIYPIGVKADSKIEELYSQLLLRRGEY